MFVNFTCLIRSTRTGARIPHRIIFTRIPIISFFTLWHSSWFHFCFELPTLLSMYIYSHTMPNTKSCFIYPWNHFCYIKVNIYAWLYIKILMGLWCVLVKFIDYIILLISIHVFGYWSHNMCNFHSLRFLINLSATIDFPSLCVECISILLCCNHDFIDLL